MGLSGDYGRFIFANPPNFALGRGLVDFVPSRAKRLGKEKSVDKGLAQ